MTEITQDQVVVFVSRVPAGTSRAVSAALFDAMRGVSESTLSTFASLPLAEGEDDDVVDSMVKLARKASDAWVGVR